MSHCAKLQSQAVDSLSKYLLAYRKQKSMLETPLRLVNAAINCDSSLVSAWTTKIGILSMMDEYRKAIEVTNEFFIRFNSDSLILIDKPVLYERLSMYDSARLLYGQLNQYFRRRLKIEPDNEAFIFHYLNTKFKVSGWDAVSAEIDWYKKRYSSNPNLMALLGSIHP